MFFFPKTFLLLSAPIYISIGYKPGGRRGTIKHIAFLVPERFRPRAQMVLFSSEPHARGCHRPWFFPLCLQPALLLSHL